MVDNKKAGRPTRLFGEKKLIGGIPPVGHKQEIRTFIDEDLMNYPELWAAAGMPNAVFSLKRDDLLVLTKGTFIKIY